MKSAAADLLGQNGSLHRENGERVCGHDGNKQRHDCIEVMREFQNEDDRGERNAHRAAEDRAHADQRPEAQTFERKEHRFGATQRSADHQQRSQDAARSAGTESQSLYRRLHAKNADDDVARYVSLNQRPDCFVTDTQRLWKDEAAEADEQTTDRRPPHPVDRKL